MSTENRRQHDRKSLIHHLCVRDKVTGEIIGFLDNISRGGIMLLSEDQMPVTDNNEIAVGLVLPSDQPRQGSIAVAVKQVWNDRDDKADLYASGLKFVDAPALTLDKIDELLNELGSREDEE